MTSFCRYCAVFPPCGALSKGLSCRLVRGPEHISVSSDLLIELATPSQGVFQLLLSSPDNSHTAGKNAKWSLSPISSCPERTSCFQCERFLCWLRMPCTRCTSPTPPLPQHPHLNASLMTLDRHHSSFHQLCMWRLPHMTHKSTGLSSSHLANNRVLFWATLSMRPANLRLLSVDAGFPLIWFNEWRIRSKDANTTLEMFD